MSEIHFTYIDIIKFFAYYISEVYCTQTRRERMSICSFFGHRKVDNIEELIDRLTLTIKKVLDEGVRTFYFGGFGEFDDLCWRVVSEYKKEYNDIERVFCLSDERHLRASKRPLWLKDEDYERFVYLDISFDWWYQRIYYRNIEMINQSSIVIFFAKEQENSGAYKALKYAIKKKKRYINLV